MIYYNYDMRTIDDEIAEVRVCCVGQYSDVLTWRMPLNVDQVFFVLPCVRTANGTEHLVYSEKMGC